MIIDDEEKKSFDWEDIPFEHNYFEASFKEENSNNYHSEIVLPPLETCFSELN